MMDWISFLFGITLGASCVLVLFGGLMFWMARPFVKANRELRAAQAKATATDGPIVWPQTEPK